jgi:3-phenylpropionate/trans-cinnamate dioxygenase ferredoxin reductase subunit
MTGRIVVVGAGHAGVQLADSLRDEGFAGEIVLLGDEEHLPYQRPPLTKDYLHDRASAELLPLRGVDFYADRGIELVTGRRVVRIDRQAGLLELDDSSALGFDQLVLATGARCRRHPATNATSGAVHTIRDAHDADRFGADLERARTLAIVGAGFIGLEVAAAARAQGVEVTIITSKSPLSRIASAPLSSFLLEAHSALGSRFVFDEVVSIEDGPTAGGVVVCATAGRIEADLVLVAVGADANSELATEAGLAVSAGIVVDEYSRTSDPRIWAIGDVAVRRTARDGFVREESVQAATHQAQCLARTLVGHPTHCTEVPWFWSTQGKLRLQIAGLPDPTTQAVLRGDPASGRFSVFGYAAGRLVAVESVNCASDHLSARRILAHGRSLSPAQAADPAFDLKAFSLETAVAS